MGHDPGPVQSNSHPHIFLTRSILILWYSTVSQNCVCNHHSRGFPHQQDATFLFYFILPGQTENAMVYLYQYALMNSGFGGLVISMLASGTQDRGFAPG
jgi:hypothetical protein